MAWPRDVTKADLLIVPYRGSGPGGQHRNKTMSCCRITHTPTGIVAHAEEQRHYPQNKKVAFKRLVEKLGPLMKKAILEARGDIPPPNKERIRTYHEKRGTVVDHRVPGVVFSYSQVLEGDLTPVIEKNLTKKQQIQGQSENSLNLKKAMKE